MHRKFLIALAKNLALDDTREQIVRGITREAEKQIKLVDRDYNDAKLIAAGLRADEGSIARRMAETFLEDALQAAEIKPGQDR